MTKSGFMVAAPCSGSGKTTVTLGILRALKNAKYPCSPAKAGPDFIDPTYHKAASGKECINLDPWAMSETRLQQLAGDKEGTLVVEAMMGLYDGAVDGSGTPADLAKLLGLSVVFVVDCSRQSQSIAALVKGFIEHDDNVEFAGIILNRVGSKRHEAILRDALHASGIEVLGAIHRNAKLTMPSRHLGLFPADEHPDLEFFIAEASQVMKECVDLERLVELKATKIKKNKKDDGTTIPPLGQKIAIAKDVAFAFVYPHLLQAWKAQGAEISFFSPLKNETPNKKCDAIFLPGGYPELHCQQLSKNYKFFNALQKAQEQNTFIYGECGGYMVLGEGIIDSDGVQHKMANLLPLITSFATRKLNLGYRVASLLEGCPLGEVGASFTAHEFHYSTIVDEEYYVPTPKLFNVIDAVGTQLGQTGMKMKNTMGSYIHLTDVKHEK